MKFFDKNKNTIAKGGLYIALFIVIVYLQINYDKTLRAKTLNTTGITKYILPSFVVNNFSFGFKNILADLYWINLIQDFTKWNHKDDFYFDEYRNLATLDPKFSYPYLFGILTVSLKKIPNNLHKMEPISNIGIKNLPDNWEIPFYLGTEFNSLRNYEKALQYIEIAISRPDAPIAVQTAYDLYKKKKLSVDNASQMFIQTIYDTTESKTIKTILDKEIMLINLNKVISTVVEAYKNKFGIYPSSVDDLAQKKFMKVSPALEKEFIVKINKNTGEVRVMRRE